MNKSLLFLFTAGVAVPCAVNGAISIVAPGTDVYTQNFAGLPGDGIWTDDDSLAGWYANKTAIVSTPSGGANGILRYGASEYAFGLKNGGPGTNDLVVVGAQFTNATGFAIAGINIDYQGEQWYRGTQTTATGLIFEYSTNATSLSTGSWTAVTALNFAAPLTSGSGTLLTVPSVVSSISSDIALSVANGGSFWIRWTDNQDATGSDHGLAIDNFKLDVTAVPEPSTYAMLLGVLAMGAVMLRRRVRR